MEGVWKERRRLETELAVRREEVERLRASEDAARAAATVLDGKVEDLSAALKQEQARAKREAEAAVAAEARDAMEALRRQLDDLRKEVERTKQGQVRARDGGGDGGGGARGAGPNLNVAGPMVSATGEAGANAGRRTGEAANVTGAAGASPPSPSTLVVLESEFQRLRAKYEKAKGRIVALEELVAASRRVSAQARREFQVRESRACTMPCWIGGGSRSTLRAGWRTVVVSSADGVRKQWPGRSLSAWSGAAGYLFRSGCYRCRVVVNQRQCRFMWFR